MSRYAVSEVRLKGVGARRSKAYKFELRRRPLSVLLDPGVHPPKPAFFDGVRSVPAATAAEGAPIPAVDDLMTLLPGGNRRRDDTS